VSSLSEVPSAVDCASQLVEEAVPKASTESKSGVTHQLDLRFFTSSNKAISTSFTALLDHAPIGVHCVDANGVIQWANRTELDMLGYEPDEYIGQPLAKFHLNSALIDNVLQQLQAGDSVESREVRLWHKSGSIKTGSINSNAIWEDGKFIHTWCFTRDTTGTLENGKIKETLYRLIDRLQRTASLQDVYDAALTAIEESLQCPRSSILLFDDARSMRFVASRGLSDEYRCAVDGHSPWTADAVNPAPITIDDVETSTLSDELKAIVKREGIRSLAFIPLVSDGKLIGKFMTYFDVPFRFGPDQIDLCLSIARQVSFSVARKQAELALAATELNFREMIDALPAAVYTTDANGKLIHFNPAAAELAGRIPVSGEDKWCVCWKLYQPDGTPLPHDECPMAVALKEGQIVRDAEAILERPNGERRWFTPFPTPLRDAKGKVVGGINMLVDITERKRTEQALAQHASQLALVTNIAPVYIAQCDRDSRYQFVNEPHARRFGLNAREVRGRHIADVLGADAYSVVKPYIDTVLSGSCVEFDMTLAEPTGKRFVHCWYVPDINDDGVVTGWVAAIADITERKLIEETLRSREEELKDADRRKDEFLAMLSHELRNPLAPIANAVHILRAAPASSAAFTQARAIIERQTARLARLVDDLLEVSRISTGRIKLNMERIAAAGIIERSIESVRPLIDQRRHSISISMPEQTIWLEGDSARLEQVFVNLLTNACKYTDDGGAIEVTAEVHGAEWIVRIRDNGIGIPKDLLPRIFDLFTQAERTLDRSQGGLGIGLALAHRLISMHAGTVTVESTEHNGSIFTVTLPVADAPTSISNVEITSNHDTIGSPLRILVADDNGDAAKSLAILLEACGHQTWIAHDGKEALQLAGQCQPHMAFLDIGLPEMDGYALVKQLRESNCRDTICVAITGYGQTTDRERAIAAGFNEHLVKPVEFDILEKFIKQAAPQCDEA